MVVKLGGMGVGSNAGWGIGLAAMVIVVIGLYYATGK
jgi:hypothetical protein